MASETRQSQQSEQSRHISVHIDRPASEVYAYASEPTNMPEWASGIGDAIDEVDGRWVVQTAGGPIDVEFAPRNEFGVLDHWVTLPSGEVVYVPLRAIADETGCEVVFTLRRLAGMSDEEFARDAAAVTADLDRLKAVMERD